MEKIAFLISQFPETHETFILREFLELKQQGIQFSIYSLKNCNDKIIHPSAKQLTAQTVYSNFLFSRQLIHHNLKTFFRHPLRFTFAIFTIFYYHRKTPSILFKTLAAIPKTVFYANLMKKQGVAHLHVHWANIPTTLGWFIHKLTNMSYSFTAHAFDIFLDNPMLAPKIGSATFVVTCTDYNRKHLQSLVNQPQKILLNYHGIDLTELPKTGKQPTFATRQNSYFILSIGRLKEQKGFPYLIESCHLLKQQGLKIHCQIVGEGPDRESLENLIAALQVADCVQLVGLKSQQEIMQLYEWADIFVLPCVIASDGDRDGIPNVLIEALALQVPVVSTNVSGVPEIIRDRGTGLLAQSRDAVDLGEKIKYLLTHSELRFKLARNGRKWVERLFNIQVNVKQLSDIFREQLSNLTKIKIVHIIDEFIAAGAQQLLIDLLKNMDKSIYHFTTIGLLDDGGLKDDIINAGSDVIVFDKKEGVDLSLLIKLTRQLSSAKADVVHTHLFSAGLWGRLAAVLAGVPVIIHTEHNITAWKNKTRRWIDKSLGYFTDKIIAVSDDVRQSLINIEKIAPAKIKLIKNGIDFSRLNQTDPDLIRKEFGISDHHKVVGIVAGLNEKKGHDYFIEAAANILKRRNSTKFFIIGDGPLRRNLKELVIQKKLTRDVIFTGVRRDVQNFLSLMNVFVLSSVREGLPLSLLEALWMKVPAVVTNVGGMPEVIRNGETGLLVPPQNAEAMATAIETMLDKPQQARDMAERAFDFIRIFFSVNAMVQEYQNLYQECIHHEN